MPDTGGQSEALRLVAEKLPAGTLGAAVGGVVGGPVGALVGSAATPILEYLLTRANERYVRNAGRVLDDAATMSGHKTDELYEYLEADDDRLSLTIRAVVSALDTLDQRKLDSLTRVLAYGLEDDAKLDMATMYVSAIRPLEAPHIRVLDYFCTCVATKDAAGWSGARISDLNTQFPGLSDGLDPILSTLDREGLAHETFTDGGDAYGNSDSGWSITSFGQNVTAWLDDSKPACTSRSATSSDDIA